LLRNAFPSAYTPYRQYSRGTYSNLTDTTHTTYSRLPLLDENVVSKSNTKTGTWTTASSYCPGSLCIHASNPIAGTSCGRIPVSTRHRRSHALRNRPSASSTPLAFARQLYRLRVRLRCQVSFVTRPAIASKRLHVTRSFLVLAGAVVWSAGARTGSI
jgi:hypothetical protein